MLFVQGVREQFWSKKGNGSERAFEREGGGGREKRVYIEHVRDDHQLKEKTTH